MQVFVTLIKIKTLMIHAGLCKASASVNQILAMDSNRIFKCSRMLLKPFSIHTLLTVQMDMITGLSLSVCVWVSKGMPSPPESLVLLL